MELKSSLTKAVSFLKKYKHIALIVVLGAIFMMIPSKSQNNTEPATNETTPQQNVLSTEDRLAVILKQIDGAGKVEVMLTIAESENIIFQTDQDVMTDDNSSKVNSSTVIITDANRNQTALIKQRTAPVYQGAIIVCEGGDDPVVRLSIMEAVSKITGLKSNSISVLKMK